MNLPRVWVRLTSVLVPRADRADWAEEWHAELEMNGGTMTDAWGALADAWYLRTEGWTMEAMLRDVRTAIRGLIRRPMFTAMAGLTLAGGIGANTAIFSVVDGVLINPLPFPEAERVVSYNFEAPGLEVKVPVIPLSAALYAYYLENANSLESFAVLGQGNVNLISDGEPQRLASLEVTHQYFEVIGVQPFLGRGFIEGEDRPDAEPVAVLGYGLYQRAFGGDRSVVGRLVEMDGVQRRVVGIMPANVTFFTEDVWIPKVIDPTAPDAGSFGHIGVGRLAEGATILTADVEMQDLLVRFSEAYPELLPRTFMEDAQLASNVKALKDVFVQDIRQVLWILLGTVGFVLLIACANVANLFLVRAETRQREQALRTALGASRGDLIRQHLTESVTLAIGGGLVGLGLAYFGVMGLLKLAPAELPKALDIGIDGSVLVFTAIISVVSGIAFGLFPAFRGGPGDLSHSLKDGGRAATSGRERHRTRSGLVIAQISLALMLLVGSGLMLRSFIALRSVDPGFDPAGVMTYRLGLPDVEYPDANQVLDFQRLLTDRIAAIPGVTSVGMIDGVPLTDSKSASPMEPVDRPTPDGELAPLVEGRSVTPGYFETMRIAITEGRPLEWGDQGTQYRAAVISAVLAQSFWPNESAVGRHIRRQGTEDSWEVVGIAADVRFDGVRDEPTAVIYTPSLQGNQADPLPMSSFDVVVRAGGDPLGAIAGVREVMRSIDSRLPMINPRTMESIVSDSMASTSFTVILLGISAGMALLLGIVGIYGVVSYIVGRRTQEIGVRMALGAPAAVILKSVVSDGLRLTGIGVALGLLGAWGVSQALGSLLYGVAATDPLTFGGTALLLTVVATIATWIPARRASRIDPVEALSSE